MIFPEGRVLVEVEALRGRRSGDGNGVVFVPVGDGANHRIGVRDGGIVVFGGRFEKIGRRARRRGLGGVVMEPEPALDCARRLRYEGHFHQRVSLLL